MGLRWGTMETDTIPQSNSFAKRQFVSVKRILLIMLILSNLSSFGDLLRKDSLKQDSPGSSTVGDQGSSSGHWLETLEFSPHVRYPIAITAESAMQLTIRFSLH